MLCTYHKTVNGRFSSHVLKNKKTTAARGCAFSHCSCCVLIDCSNGPSQQIIHIFSMQDHFQMVGGENVHTPRSGNHIGKHERRNFYFDRCLMCARLQQETGKVQIHLRPFSSGTHTHIWCYSKAVDVGLLECVKPNTVRKSVAESESCVTTTFASSLRVSV